MIGKYIISTLSLVLPLSDILDMVSHQVVNHHRRVATIAYFIGSELNLTIPERRDLFLAGIFHDIGAFSLQERLNFLSFDIDDPHRHAEIGYQLLKEFSLLTPVAEIIRFHHVPWGDGDGRWFNGLKVPPASHIIHLADRISVLLPDQSQVLGQAPAIVREIERYSGSRFKPELVEAFAGLAGRECFWLDAAASQPTAFLLPIVDAEPVELDMDALHSLTKLFSKVIDFRSSFTATHSSGVAASAEALASLAGFTGNELQLIRFAGYLHDLGKLAVPAAILEKPGRLTPAEWDVVRAHTFYGYRTLEKIPHFEMINMWGSLHHERLDGQGYPFHLRGEELPLGSRIMAVADVFTALTENRPYRAGLPPAKALAIIIGMAGDGALDGNIVDLLRSNLPAVDDYRRTMAGQAFEHYRQFLAVPESKISG